MTRILGAAVAAMVVMLVVGCGSTKSVGSSSETAAATENRANGVPEEAMWIGIGSFTSEELKNAPEKTRAYKGYVSEDGLFFTGEAEKFGSLTTTTSSAELAAKGSIASHIRDSIIRFVENETFTQGSGQNTEETKSQIEVTGTAVATKVSGIRRVDRYVDKNTGTVHVLMFVSNKNIQAAAKDTSMSDYERQLIEAVFPVGSTVQTTSSVQ